MATVKPKKLRKSTTLKLGSHPVKLHFVDLSNVSIDSDASGEGFQVYGFFDSQKNAIYIDTQHPVERVQDTLIHEALHAVDIEYNLGISHQKIHVIATGLQQLLSKYLKKI